MLNLYCGWLKMNIIMCYGEHNACMCRDGGCEAWES